MSTCRKTTFDELYDVLIKLVGKTTHRPVWRKHGMQVAPKGPYATVYMTEGDSPVQDVIEEVEAASPGEGDPSFIQYPVGLTRLDCKVEFFRNAVRQPALTAAIRFRQSLQLESRFYDLWEISGLCGDIRTVDVSEMFRADVEGRAEVRFGLYADIGATILPGSTDQDIYQIDHQQVAVYRDDATPPPTAEVTINRED